MSRIDMDTFEKRLLDNYYDVPSFVRQKYVVDEDKTVRENKRLEEEHNKSEEARKRLYIEQRRSKRNERTEDLKEAIKEYSFMQLNDKQVEHIMNYISENFDDCSIRDWVHDICGLLDLLDHVNDAS